MLRGNDGILRNNLGTVGAGEFWLGERLDITTIMLFGRTAQEVMPPVCIVKEEPELAVAVHGIAYKADPNAVLVQLRQVLFPEGGDLIVFHIYKPQLRELTPESAWKLAQIIVPVLKEINNRLVSAFQLLEM